MLGVYMMEIAKMMKERLGFNSKRLTMILVVCLVGLPVLAMYGDSAFNLIGRFAKAKTFWGDTQLGLAGSNVDFKNDFSQPTSIPDQKVFKEEQLAPRFADGSSSNNESLQPTSMSDDTKLNGTLNPGIGDGSSSQNDSTQPTSIRNGKVLSGPLDYGSSLQNKSFLLTNVSDDKMHNGQLAPGFDGRSNLKNDSPQPATKPDGKPLSFRPTSIHYDEFLRPLAPRFGAGLGSKPASSQTIRRASGKLLDGLLAAGFDEGSCLSRYQAFLYRKASPYKPSSYLISRLRKYEYLHKHCGPNTKTYDKTLKRLKSNQTSSSSKCKYLVWLGFNGMGNRMISMASAFLYALLTNRVLLVDHGADMTGLFCEPFPYTSWLLPRDFPLKKEFHSLTAQFPSSLKLRRAHMTNTSDKSPPPFVFFKIPHGDYDLDEVFLCDQSRALLEKVPWLILSSDQYIAPSLFLSPSFKQEAINLFPEKETVFHHLGRYLFHPSNKAWGLITKFYEAHLAKTDQIIGLQIRVFNRKASPFEVVMGQILSCVLKRNLLPEVDTQKSIQSPSGNQTSKTVLITSLHSEYYENMSSMYRSRPTVTGEIVKVYQPSHEEYQHKGDNVHNMKAWAEIYLLSFSDVLVTSSWSTFGYVAQGLAGLKPWVLIKTKVKQVPDPPACRREKSMEPCFHYAPNYYCNGKSEVDPGALVPYIRHCVDRTGGVKLVNDRKRL